MATYVNNLRLKEITTGDEDGTWGTSTNTNLELIGEGLGYGTEQVAADSNETFTMADGVADGMRGMYLKFTSAGSLTATRTLTLAPNTVSKVWIIENATTGSQIITIKQGAGATVNIASGAKKVVYTDGAGSGAAVFDADPTAATGGTVTSVGTTGTVNGITLTGTVTSSGSLTLGGTLGSVDLTSQITGTLPIANGGTNSTSTTYCSLTANVSGTLPVANGGTGVTSSTGTGAVVLGTSPTLATPVLGTPSSGNLTSCTADGTDEVGFRNVPAVGTKTGSYTLAVTDVGKYVQLGTSGSIIIPNATFSEGDAISIFNNTAAAIALTCSITTAYISGTNTDEASVDLATRGVCTILFISSTVCVISGAVS